LFVEIPSENNQTSESVFVRFSASFQQFALSLNLWLVCLFLFVLLFASECIIHTFATRFRFVSKIFVIMQMELESACNLLMTECQRRSLTAEEHMQG
jgi:hypothetical protein